jgi:ribulose-phosphate 3-epimerase
MATRSPSLRTETMIKIAPSILAADFGNLRSQIEEAERGGADWIHIDVMDGHFVPNITFGPMLVSAARKCTRLPLDVHLMIEEPDRFIKDFSEAGADRITVHQEASLHLHRTLEAIKERNVKAGIALNPATPVFSLEEIVGVTDLILIMTVEPGYGSQSFIPFTLRKIREARKLVEEIQKEIFIEVDGGINPQTAPEVVRAGADVLVAGTAIFREPSIAKAISTLRSAATP